MVRLISTHSVITFHTGCLTACAFKDDSVLCALLQSSRVESEQFDLAPVLQLRHVVYMF